MRFVSVLTAILVMISLYLLVFEREAVIAFAAGETAGDGDAATAAEDSGGEDNGGEDQIALRTVAVVAMNSVAERVDRLVLVRGRTEAARQVDLRAETSGQVASDPLRKGNYVQAGDALCRIDPGTRQVALAETEARLTEARSRLPEARARLAEAEAAQPAAVARIAEAKARVPEARARLAEAEAAVPASLARLAEAEAAVPAAEARLAEARAGVPAAEARLKEAESRLPEAEARVTEANARLNEALINLNAAQKLAEDGFASKTRVAATEAAAEAARAGVRSALSQLEGAKAGVQTARSQLEGAKAAVESARSAIQGARAAIEYAGSQIEGTRAAVESAKSQVEGAGAGVISAESALEGARAGVQAAKSGVDGALAGIQSAETAVASAKREIERLTITAPFAGLLESDAAELGSLLQPGDLCATIVQLDPVKLVGFVPETEVDKVKLAAAAGARLATGREVEGRVTFLSRAADPNTRTFRVEVTIPNAALQIRDGQTAEIVIRAPGEFAHLVPQSALTLDDAGQLGVRTVEADDTAGFAAVTVLRDTTEGVWIAGLPQDARIITVGQEFVTDGVPLRPTYREARR